jgi:acetyl esterase/lipase
MKTNHFILIITFSMLSMAGTSQQAPLQMPLYEGALPNAKSAPERETSTFADNVLRVARVSVPTLTVYRPEKPNGAAVIICPGGGYHILAFDKEGTLVAEQFAQRGYTAAVLKYRLPNDTLQVDRSMAPLQDAQQAIRLLRSKATEWQLNKRKIGIMGFSAGGHLASTTATHFTANADAGNQDTTSVRPDFAILIYPVISFDSTITHKGSRNKLVGSGAPNETMDFFSNEKQVTAKTPPTFLVHAGDDAGVPVQNSLRFYEACLANKVPAEMHLYPKGGHGFGMYNRTTTDSWMDRMFNWLETLK